MSDFYMVIDKTLDEPIGTIHKHQQDALDEMMAYKIENPDHELYIEWMGLALGANEVKKVLTGDNDDEV